MIINTTNYIDDVRINNVSRTAINCLCVFNQVPNFHVMDNIVCDIMHIIPKEVGRYDMANVINRLIRNKYFTFYLT